MPAFEEIISQFAAICKIKESINILSRALSLSSLPLKDEETMHEMEIDGMNVVQSVVTNNNW